MLRGLTTVTFFATDLSAARAWYTEVLGIEPYFVREHDGRVAYLEFRLGDFQHELGLVDSRFAPHPLPQSGEAAGAVTYWAVDDVEAAYARLLELGATAHDPVTPRGPGFVTASVIDPFGNVLGVMYNQHYLDVTASLNGAASLESSTA
ncbi:VOC family protein [Intrasporangium sp.]|uniref:VOC family protein n=1 Tax=Intrasporangium sp. TaxID=1925024 RepID=UPI002939E06F|nr:VOC family protein [Intrasporangium sp.]MDV3222139.1 VOC family protein [Intrasporangium sp.]